MQNMNGILASGTTLFSSIYLRNINWYMSVFTMDSSQPFKLGWDKMIERIIPREAFSHCYVVTVSPS